MPRFTRFSSRFVGPERYANRVSRSLSATTNQNRLARLEREEYLRFPDNKKWQNAPPWVVKDAQLERPKEALKASALLEVQRRLSSFREADFSNPKKRAAYRALRANEEGLKKSPGAKPAGADRRQQYASRFGQTIYGSSALTSGVRDKVLSGEKWLPVFKHAAAVIPCVQRAVRREVMFAIGFGGQGSHKKKRRTESSGVPC